MCRFIDCFRIANIGHLCYSYNIDYNMDIENIHYLYMYSLNFRMKEFITINLKKMVLNELKGRIKVIQ